jgi:hypothetical protein
MVGILPLIVVYNHEHKRCPLVRKQYYEALHETNLKKFMNFKRA